MKARWPHDATTERIRPAEEEDCDAIAEIYNDGIMDGNATFDEFDVRGKRYSKYIKDSTRCSLLCALIDKLVVGWSLIEPKSERFAYRFTANFALYIRHGYRGRGIGMALSLAAEAEATRLGYHSIVSENLSTNPASIALDINNGYFRVGEIREAGFRNGEWIGLVLMQKILRP